jgi:hypothetical protein
MSPEELRQFAERCRQLGTIAIVPEVREQLEMWAAEFDARVTAAEDGGKVIRPMRRRFVN